MDSANPFLMASPSFPVLCGVRTTYAPGVPEDTAVDRVTPPNEVQSSSPLRGTGDFADGIKLKILRWGGYLGLYGWVNVIIIRAL